MTCHSFQTSYFKPKKIQPFNNKSFTNISRKKHASLALYLVIWFVCLNNNNFFCTSEWSLNLQYTIHWLYWMHSIQAFVAFIPNAKLYNSNFTHSNFASRHTHTHTGSKRLFCFTVRMINKNFCGRELSSRIHFLLCGSSSLRFQLFFNLINLIILIWFFSYGLRLF